MAASTAKLTGPQKTAILILALGDAELAGRIRAAREGFASDVETAAAKLGSKL